MVNYQLGKIYKIVDNSNGNTYIGSTCEPTLACRLSKHKYDYKNQLKRLTSSQIFANNDYNIILIESYPCNSRDELHARERYYIETIKCVNKQITGRTQKEYYEHYKEKIKENVKQYWNDNKEDINEKRNIVLECPCGGKYSKRHQARHLQSKLHQDYIINNSSTQP
jgi:hypothetical protein